MQTGLIAWLILILVGKIKKEKLSSIATQMYVYG
jgi:hypothetical protein